MPSETTEGLRERLNAMRLFLTGSGLWDGRSFGDDPPAGKGRYWWRLPLDDLLREVDALLSHREPEGREAPVIEVLQKEVHDGLGCHWTVRLRLPGIVDLRSGRYRQEAAERIADDLRAYFGATPPGEPVKTECPNCHAPLDVHDDGLATISAAASRESGREPEDGDVAHPSHRWGGTSVPGTGDIATCADCGVDIDDGEALEPCPNAAASGREGTEGERADLWDYCLVCEEWEPSCDHERDHVSHDAISKAIDLHPDLCWPQPEASPAEDALREAFVAGFDLGTDYADTHTPGRGFASAEYIAARFDRWLTTRTPSEREPGDAWVPKREGS